MRTVLVAYHLDAQFHCTSVVREVLSRYLNRVCAGRQPRRYPQMPYVSLRLSIPYHWYWQRTEDARGYQPGVTVRAHRYQQVITRARDGLIQRSLKFGRPAVDH